MRHTFRSVWLAGLALLATTTVTPPANAARDYLYCRDVNAYELGSCRTPPRLPTSPMGTQMRWVLKQFSGGARSLTDTEVQQHVDPQLLAVFPAQQIIAAFRSTVDEVGPATFRGFDYPARQHEGVALADTPTLAAGVNVSVSPATGLITDLGLTEAPPTIVPRGPHSGWFDVGGRRLFIRCTGHGSPTEAFENGLTSDWYDLQNRLSRRTQVCSYDPALQNGAFTRSDPAPTPRTGAVRPRARPPPPRPGVRLRPSPAKRCLPPQRPRADATHRGRPRQRPAPAAARGRSPRTRRARRSLQRRPVQPALREPPSAPGSRSRPHRWGAPGLPPAQRADASQPPPPGEMA